MAGWTLLIFAGMAVGGSGVQAANPQGLPPGSRVRVHLVTGQTVQADIVGASSDALQLAPATGTFDRQRTIEFSDIAALEQRIRTRNKAKTGAVVGGVVWAVLAAVWIKELGVRESGVLSGNSVGLLAVSVGGGAGIGSLFREEQWEPVPIPRASHREAAVSFRIRF